MKKKYDEIELIKVLRNYLKKINSKQNPCFENYRLNELVKCFYLYQIPFPIIDNVN